jgi:hypothetical protein
LQQIEKSVNDDTDAATKTSITESAASIKACYPSEVLDYYSPDYSKTLLDKINDFQPPSQPVTTA